MENLWNGLLMLQPQPALQAPYIYIPNCLTASYEKLHLKFVTADFAILVVLQVPSKLMPLGVSKKGKTRNSAYQDPKLSQERTYCMSWAFRFLVLIYVS